MSGPLKISQYPPAASAEDTDEMVANQNGTTRKVTIGQVRATLAPVSHTHTEADLLGTIAPAKLGQAGATSGQVLKWNGSAWAPAADNVGTGGGSTDWSALTGIPAAIDAIDALTPAADRIAYYTGANAAALAPLTGFARSLLDDADAAAARGTLGAAASAHTHAIADITNLQTTLDGKAAAAHTHTAAQVTDFNAAARTQTEAMVLAGANVALTYAGTGASRTATIAAVGGAASYAALSANRTAAATDNGRVIECDGTNRTLTLPAGLGKGFACVVRRAGAGNATVAKGSGVTFAPTDANVATTALWDEIAIECVADTGSAATYLVRLVPA
jgi:3',5'-cyclic AMP phosphodiesterase CpdA